MPQASYSNRPASTYLTQATGILLSTLSVALVLVATTLSTLSAETLERELWYTGFIQKQPAASMHVSIFVNDDGSRRTVAATNIILARTLGANTVSIEVGETQEMWEDPNGQLTAFRIDQNQNGSVVSATGTIADGKVVAHVARLGRTAEQIVPISPGQQLVGMQASQELAMAPGVKIGDKIPTSGVVLLAGAIQIMTTSAELSEIREDGSRLFLISTPAMPPFRTLLDAKGDLLKMEVNLGFLNLILVQADGPVALAGAEISPTGLAKATGPVPRVLPINTYQLGDAAAVIPTNDFQSCANTIITVRSVALPNDLPNPEKYLRAEPQYELDDPEMRAWVAEAGALTADNTAQLAEILRLQVRTRLSQKDLAMADGSALEAFRSQRGDCTEHANLLTAALRIAGIPARTEVGVVYAAPYGGWVGHAWHSAYINGSWVHLDSAYPGIPRSLYLMLANSGGDDPVSTAGALAKAIVALSGSSIEYLLPADAP